MVINSSKFTDKEHAGDPSYGYTVYPSFSLFSFTFAAILEDSKDNGTLPYMSVSMAGQQAGIIHKASFLTCGWWPQAGGG